LVGSGLSLLARKLHAVVGIVSVVNKRWLEVGCAGVPKCIGGQCLEFMIKGFPFLKESGGRCHVLLRIHNEEVVMVIIVEYFDSSIGVVIMKLADRNLT